MAQEAAAPEHSVVCLRLMQAFRRVSRGMRRWQDGAGPPATAPLSPRHVAALEQLRGRVRPAAPAGLPAIPEQDDDPRAHLPLQRLPQHSQLESLPRLTTDQPAGGTFRCPPPPCCGDGPDRGRHPPPPHSCSWALPRLSADQTPGSGCSKWCARGERIEGLCEPLLRPARLVLRRQPGPGGGGGYCRLTGGAQAVPAGPGRKARLAALGDQPV